MPADLLNHAPADLVRKPLLDFIENPASSRLAGDRLASDAFRQRQQVQPLDKRQTRLLLNLSDFGNSAFEQEKLLQDAERLPVLLYRFLDSLFEIHNSTSILDIRKLCFRLQRTVYHFHGIKIKYHIKIALSIPLIPAFLITGFYRVNPNRNWNSFIC